MQEQVCWILSFPFQSDKTKLLLNFPLEHLLLHAQPVVTVEKGQQ